MSIGGRPVPFPHFVPSFASMLLNQNPFSSVGLEVFEAIGILIDEDLTGINGGK
jgi:hypothetical protein